jgi:hypothetical protein
MGLGQAPSSTSTETLEQRGSNTLEIEQRIWAVKEGALCGVGARIFG